MLLDFNKVSHFFRANYHSCHSFALISNCEANLLSTCMKIRTIHMVMSLILNGNGANSRQIHCFFMLNNYIKCRHSYKNAIRPSWKIDSIQGDQYNLLKNCSDSLLFNLPAIIIGWLPFGPWKLFLLKLWMDSKVLNFTC